MWISAALGAASAAWAAFQWQQLLVARRGGEAFCLGTGGSCTAMWDSGFASAVQAYTVLPVAGWGVVWGLAATLFPLLALWRRQRGSAEPFWSAALLTAMAGGIGVLVLLGASLWNAGLCSTCAITYAGVTAYGAAILTAGRPEGGLSLPGGLASAGAAVAAAWLALLVPGQHTPASSNAALEALTEPSRAAHADAGSSPARAESAPGPAGLGDPTGIDLHELIGRLDDQQRQVFADLLAVYASSPAEPVPPPRALYGSAIAPVRITEWIDGLCGHCAHFHETLEMLLRAAPEGSFAIETRHFPLDAGCNAMLAGEAQNDLHCLAARSMICLEQSPRAFEYAGDLFAHQRSLDEDELYAIASEYTTRAELDKCLRDPATAQKLADDVEAAKVFHPRGTPLVVVNGRRTVGWGPFLYGLILAGGNTDNPAFAALPAPSAAAHTASAAGP